MGKKQKTEEQELNEEVAEEAAVRRLIAEAYEHVERLDRDGARVLTDLLE